VFFYDWIIGNSIGHDSLIYREVSGLILVKKIQNVFSKFLMLKKHVKTRNKLVETLQRESAKLWLWISGPARRGANLGI
jgi:hypothetical protein